MIKANELRIGNMLYSLVGKVLGEKQMVIVDLNHIKHIQQGNEYGYTPVHITEYWLYCCGFKWGSNENGYRLNEFVLHYDEHAGWGIDFKGNFLTGIDYVHQLQNLYHALTGEELFIQTSTPQPSTPPHDSIN